uniref:DUF1232 domain-containing protein n=1 Tax=uncultured marine thaumarchaeote KM3_78_A04 TaxID=1456289 RepID=A0A075HUR5_9ARCH|nr:hypothetical protein [uncultured marine thaumarchaeote KM3_78_A04]
MVSLFREQRRRCSVGLTLVLVMAVVSGLFALTAVLMLRWLGKREPYSNFIKLRTRRKLTFVRLMMGDDRVPMYVKFIPVLLLLYLTSPIDLVPDFIPVLGYLDDVVIALLALALIIKLTSGPVVLDLLQRAQLVDATS